MESPKQKITVTSLAVEIKNPSPEFISELEHARNTQYVMYIGRFIYGIPEEIIPIPDKSTILVIIQPMPDLLDPWALTQDIKDMLEEVDKNGEFSDD